MNPLFANPLLNPIFFPLVARIFWGFVAGLVLIFAWNRFTCKGLWKSKVGAIYLGWLILLPLYSAGVLFGWLAGMTVIFTLSSLAVWEIVRITKLPRVYGYMLTALALVTVVAATFFPARFFLLPLTYLPMMAFVSVRRNDAKTGFMYAAVGTYVAMWVIFGLSHLLLLAHLNGRFDQTGALAFVVIFAVTLSDIGAFVFGKLFHKWGILDQFKVASAISPNKTYVGILGEIIGAGLGVWAMYFAVKGYLPWYQWVCIAILIGVFGSAGGMMNSLFKRAYGVKDSGHLLEGLGGALDRIDSTIRVVVVLYYYLSFFLVK